MLYFGDNEENEVTISHSVERKHALLGEIKSKSKKLAPRKKVALELLHHRLCHRSTRSLMDRYNANVWQDIELRIDADPFCTSCQISSMQKKAGSKNRLNPKSPFKKGFVDIIPATAPNVLTN